MYLISHKDGVCYFTKTPRVSISIYDTNNLIAYFSTLSNNTTVLCCIKDDIKKAIIKFL